MISIIVSVYNCGQYLRQCLDSILAQTYTDLEILLVDDGSDDNTGDICDAYMKADPRVKAVHKKNGGAVSARKAGLERASGRYIAFVDGDDWIEPDMMEKLYSVLTKQRVDVAMCGRYEDTGNASKPVFQGIPAGRYDKADMLEKVYPKMIVNGGFFEWGIFSGTWDKLFKRESVEKFQMAVDDRLTVGDDAACVYPCILNADSIYIVDECLYHYRQTPASMVKQIRSKKEERERFGILYNSVKNLFEKYKNIYDLREQWTEYLLFLMVPRADLLYENIDGLDFLFPFPQVKRNSRIIIYGMGTYGQRLYKYIKRSGFCTIVACSDKNYSELSKQGIPAVSPDNICDYEYDAVVVANSFANVQKEIYDDLIKRCPAEKVHVMDEKLIKSDVSLKAFRLL